MARPSTQTTSTIAHRGQWEVQLVKLILSHEEAKVLTATIQVNLPSDSHRAVNLHHHLHPLILVVLLY